MFVDYCVLRVALFLVVRWLLRVACVCCWLFVAGCLLHVVCCMLFVAGMLLFVVCCLVCVDR